MFTQGVLRRSILRAASVCALILGQGMYQSALAQAGPGFGPETFTLTSKKASFTRTFTAGDDASPYTLTITNGASDGSHRIKKGWVTLNGSEILDNEKINKNSARLALAIRPDQQNEVKIKLKGNSGSFLSISIEPTRSTLLNDPSNQSGLGGPFSVAIDQSNHRAYVTDRFYDSVIEFDIAEASITRVFEALDGDRVPGNGLTSGISFNSNSRTVVAFNMGITPGSKRSVLGGSIALIDLNSGEVSRTSLWDSEESMHPFFGAVNPNNSAIAFDNLYSTSRRAYFIDTVTGALTSRDEQTGPASPAINPLTNEFIFTGGDDHLSPSLTVYSALAPFQRIRRIGSSARAGTSFEKVAINPATNIAVALNQLDGAVFLFDLAEGTEVARIPISVGNRAYASGDVAVNPETGMAVVTSEFLEQVTVIDLNTRLVAAEIPLPEGTRALGVGIDHQLNRAVIAEIGIGSNRRNGSILVVQLPSL